MVATEQETIRKSRENQMADAVLLAGDRYHPADVAFEGVVPAFEAFGLEVECITDVSALNGDLLKDKKLLAILRDGMEWPDEDGAEYEVWMQPHQEQAIADFVVRGGGFLPLHNSCWAYPWRGPYRQVLGGYYQSHGPILKVREEVIADHPITAGVEPFEVVDEQHWLWFDPDRVTLFLKSYAEDGREGPAGWAHDVGEGRVAYLANGHTLEVLQHPMVRRLLENAARWVLKI